MCACAYVICVCVTCRRVSSGHDKPAPTVILDKENEDEDEDEQFVIQDSAALHMQLPEEGFAAVVDVTVNQKPEGLWFGQLTLQN